MNLTGNRTIFLSIALLAALIMLLGTAWMGDDAFITLRVIDNFVNGFGLRYNVIERVQVFTHPLWLFFLTPFYMLTREAMVTTMLVSVLLSMAALWLLACRIAVSLEYGCLLVLAAAASRALCDFSTSGLESPLTFLLLALLVWQLHRSAKIWIPAAIAGLLILNRMDLAMLVGPVAVYLCVCARGMNRLKVVAAVVLPALAWIIFALIYYGAPFPNTAYAKLGTGYSTASLIARGLVYTENFILNDPLLALLIVAALVSALRSRSWPAILLGLGILLYIAYTITIGGDFMSGRFFAAPGFVALCLLAQTAPPRWLLAHWKIAIAAGVVVLGALLVSRVTETPLRVDHIPSDGIADERRFYYNENGLPRVLEAWLITGSEPIHPWGMRFRSGGARATAPLTVVVGTVGMSGYYGGPRVHIIDNLALTDAFLARLPAVPGSRVGHYERGLPPAYAETVNNQAPVTDLAILQPLLDDVTLATRAPLLDKDRAGAIWRLLSGHYNWVYQVVKYRTRE